MVERKNLVKISQVMLMQCALKHEQTPLERLLLVRYVNYRRRLNDRKHIYRHPLDLSTLCL